MGVHIALRTTVWLDEAIGNLTNQTFLISAEPNLLFVFTFSSLKPNQRFGAVRLSSLTSKYTRTPIALY